MSCYLVVGMAGSGKTTLISQLKNTFVENEKFPYIINLDPAVSFLPYDADFDIRNIIDYKETMKKYQLGPNGAITTCLNLLATKIDLLFKFIKSKKEDSLFIIDTPGQIEVFNWSASGQIIAESLSSILPCSILFVTDSILC